MTDRPLEGRIALITGAGRGLGKAMAEGLAAKGARVALLDIERDVLAAALREVEAAGGQGCAMAVTADVTDPERARAAIDEVVDGFGGLHIVINDAAMGPQFFTNDFVGDPPVFWDVDPELWLRVLTVNAYGPQLVTSVAVPHLLKAGWGRVINITTSLDTMYLRGCGAYGPSKAALEANTRIMAHDLADTGVTANVLIPGGPANTRMIPEATGLARDELVQPEAMRAPVCWLCSADADRINGMRFIAALWDESLPPDKRVARAGAPVAWPQVNSISQRPDGWEHEDL